MTKIDILNLKSTTRELRNIRHALDEAAIVAITDRAGNIIHINKKFCDISKYSREELLGKNHRLINSGYHSKEFFVQMWKTISSGKVWEGELRNRAKDGSYYWVNTSIIPFLEENGEPYQYVSIRYEITQRKNAEEQLRVYADKLEQSNRELQDFASIAAHDLQEPLRKIQAFGDRLEARSQTEFTSEGRDYLDRMLSSAKRMRRLIDDLLTYSRIASKARAFEVADLNQVLQEVLSDLELRIEHTHAKIEVGTLPVIHADLSQMRQLFQNLIANALKFHHKDIPPVIKITGEVKSQVCVLTVQDNGIGFDEKYTDRIFTIFQRLHGKHEYEGTGVGLAVCRRIAEWHGGHIVAKSGIGRGATFSVTLPLAQS